jgi:hypothetical protein
MADFVDNSQVEGIILSHVGQIRKLEDDQAEKILKLYQNARRSMRDRLDTVAPGTFTAQRLAGALAQVDAGIAEMQRSLSGGMRDYAPSMAELGVEHLVNELKGFESELTGAVVPISLDTVSVAADASNFLFNRYDSSMEAYSSSIRSMFAQQLTQAAIEEISMGEVVQRIGQFFMAEEWRLTRLVRTELMGLYSFGKLRGMQRARDGSIPDLMKTLYHPMDKRTGEDSKRLNRNNPVVPIDEPFVENSTGKTVTYMYPPNRPNDRAIMIPYRPGWDK